MADTFTGTVAQVSAREGLPPGIRFEEYDGWYNAGQYYKGPQLTDELVGREVEFSFSPGRKEGTNFLNSIVSVDGQSTGQPKPMPKPAAPKPAAPPARAETSYGSLQDSAVERVRNKDDEIIMQSSLKSAVELLAGHPKMIAESADGRVALSPYGYSLIEETIAVANAFRRAVKLPVPEQGEIQREPDPEYQGDEPD